MKRLIVEFQSVSEPPSNTFFAQVWLSDRRAFEPEWEYALTAADEEEAQQRITTSDDGDCWVIRTALGNTPRFPKDRFSRPRIISRSRSNPSSRK